MKMRQFQHILATLATMATFGLYSCCAIQKDNDPFTSVAKASELEESVISKNGKGQYEEQGVQDHSCLILYGDTRSSWKPGSPHGKVAEQIQNEDCDSPSLFHVGDIVGTMTQTQWNGFLEAEQELIHAGEFFPMLGNHEYQGSKANHGTEGMVKFLGEEFPYLEDRLADGGKYTVQLDNDLIFIALNSEPATHRNCVEQTGYLLEQLHENYDSDVIVGFHRPPFPIIEVAGYACAQDYFHPLLEEHVDDGNEAIVISGHSHGMSVSEKDGVTYLEVGAAVKPRPCRSPERAESLWGVNNHFCSGSNTNHGDGLGYFRCDTGLNCIVKDGEGQTIYEFSVPQDNLIASND